MKEIITTAELAERWSVAESTVRKWRYNKEGPKYLKISPRKVVYKLKDILLYEKNHKMG